MLRMIKPYTVQLVLAVVFMIIFSFMSIFSIGMISPFLKALFNKTDSGVVMELPGNELSAPITTGSYDEAGVAHEGDHQASAELAERVGQQSVQGLDDDARRERYENLKDQFTGVDRWKLKFSQWVSVTMLKGTKQEALLRICIAFFLAALIKNIACYIQEVLMVYVGQAVIRDLRNQLYLKLTRLPLSYYNQHKAGELISRATNDVMVAQQCVGLSFTKLIKDPVMLTMYLGVALVLSWKMTVMALVLMPASLIVIIRIGKRLRTLSTQQQEQMADLTSTLQETVYGIRVIKALPWRSLRTTSLWSNHRCCLSRSFASTM